MKIIQTLSYKGIEIIIYFKNGFYFFYESCYYYSDLSECKRDANYLAKEMYSGNYEF